MFISFICKSTIFDAVMIVMEEIGCLFLLENKKRLKEKITCQIQITKITPFFIHKQLNYKLMTVDNLHSTIQVGLEKVR